MIDISCIIYSLKLGAGFLGAGLDSSTYAHKERVQ